MLNWTLFYGCVNILDVKYESDLEMNTTCIVVKQGLKILLYIHSHLFITLFETNIITSCQLAC